jgi:Rps23 Pro-64 3,4-dihydroxylase Tpa1-like proline 4-hydroxylase
MQLFHNDRYLQLANRLAATHASADPFPHSVIDDFLPVEVAEHILQEFPDSRQPNWVQQHSFDQKKLAAQKEAGFSDFTRGLLRELNSAGCLAFLRALTGINGLISDPYYEGGGLHQIVPGGFLKVHADFNWHPTLKLDRRLNLIIYLNKEWREEYHGHLELWDRSMSRCVKKILPVFNRAVVFNTTSWAYHGHPERLACPEGMTRKSLALYYYSNGRPEEEQNASHGVIWKERKGSWERGPVSASFLRGVAELLERPAKWMRRKANRITLRGG